MKLLTRLYEPTSSRTASRRVRMADRILVLEKGAILEDGTDASLLAADKT